MGLTHWMLFMEPWSPYFVYFLHKIHKTNRHISWKAIVYLVFGFAKLLITDSKVENLQLKVIDIVRVVLEQCNALSDELLKGLNLEKSLKKRLHAQWAWQDKCLWVKGQLPIVLNQSTAIATCCRNQPLITDKLKTATRILMLFIHSGNLYSSSSRNLLRDVPNPATAKEGWVVGLIRSRRVRGRPVCVKHDA